MSPDQSGRGNSPMTWRERHLWWLLLALLTVATVVKVGLT